MTGVQTCALPDLYDSGELNLTFEQDGKSLYYNWNTGKLKTASDYKFFVTLKKKGQNNSTSNNSFNKYLEQNADINFSLIAPIYQPSHLSTEQDLFIPAPGIPLEFGRAFPQDPDNCPYLGIFGRGWVSSFDMMLTSHTDGKIFFMTKNGFNRIFTSQTNETFTSSPGDYSVLSRDPDGTYYLREKDGFMYHFRLGADTSSNIFKIDFIEDSNGNRIQAVYDNTMKLIKIHHSNGSEINIGYNSTNRISQISDNLGRSVTYQYDATAEHLISVTRPGGRTTSYTYSIGSGAATDHRITSITYPDRKSVV